MMTRKWKLIWALMMVAMCVALTGMALADTMASGNCGADGDNLTWSLDSNGALTISGTGEMKNYDVYDTGAFWKAYRNQINTVKILSGVTTIGNNAIEGCMNLKSVTIPSSVTTIGYGAFSNCYNMTDLTIEKGVTVIRDQAFGYCESLESVTIPSSVISMGNQVFSWCVNLESVTIPSSVTSIGILAFMSCPNLTIYGETGSTAETYAKSNKIPFVALSVEPEPPASAPIKVIALNASATTAKVGDVLTFTTQFEGDGEIAWVEYHIYDTYGNHLTGYRGEGEGISGVYNYPTVNTGAGKYTARVYLMAKDGTFTQVDSVQVTVTGGTRKAVALNASTTTARVGETLTFTTQFEGDGPIAWIEYHIYDMNGNHLTGYRGEGSGISGVYNYPTVNTGAGKYTARVYLMAQDGTFTHVDSVQVTVTE